MNEVIRRSESSIDALVGLYADRVSRAIDAQALAKVEDQLAEHGYVRVTRCRDCTEYDEEGGSCWSASEPFCVEPSDFCSWAVRKEQTE